ncbi:hypothetical protein BLSTO_05849, partial [Blastocystis sp. subtype 1]
YLKQDLGIFSDALPYEHYPAVDLYDTNLVEVEFFDILETEIAQVEAYSKKVLATVKHNQDDLVVHELFAPLRVRAERVLSPNSGMRDVIDWNAIRDYLSFEMPPATHTVLSGNLLESIQSNKPVYDSIVYTSYKHNFYCFLSVVTDATPISTIPTQTKTFLDCFSRKPEERMAIDTNQPMLRAHVMPPNLQINLYERLFPDSSTVYRVHQEHGDGDRDLVFDYTLTREMIPSCERPEEEKGVDWVMKEEHFAVPTSKDYCNVFLIPQLTLFFPMKYSLFKAFLYLPSCLTYLKTIHGISSLQLELERSLSVRMNYLQLVEAFTSKDVTQFFNYDLLEIYG